MCWSCKSKTGTLLHRLFVLCKCYIDFRPWNGRNPSKLCNVMFHILLNMLFCMSFIFSDCNSTFNANLLDLFLAVAFRQMTLSWKYF